MLEDRVWQTIPVMRQPANGHRFNAGTSVCPVFPGWSQPVEATLYLKGEMECGLMGHKFHRGFTAAEKTELWDRWKRGESLKAIGRAFGKPSSSIYFFGGSAWWDSSCPSGGAPDWP